MRTKVFVLFGILSVLGCARVSVQAPKDPIKLDVTMRLDIYQHIENDIDAIENMVNGGSEQTSQAPGPQSLLGMLVSTAYADEGLSPEVESAAMRRKDRRSELSNLQAQGTIGENAAGLVELRGTDTADASDLIDAENSDRMVIYRGIAEKNGSSISEVKKLYAQRLQGDAPSGTPIEVETNWITK